MIEIESETLVPLREVSKLLPSRPNGVTGRAKTGQRGALKTGQCCCDASYTSSVQSNASFC